MLPHGSADAYFFSRLATHNIQHDAGKPLFILTADAQVAERLQREMAFFAPKLLINRLPDWETLPYDQFSPHPDLVSERLATLYQFSQRKFDVGIVPVTTAMTRLAPLEYLAGRAFFLRAKTRLNIDAMRESLTFAGYTHTSQVMTPGEYAVRGGLIDLFPMGSTVPYRVDLFGDEIDAIRTFDIDTQRSIYPVNEIRLLPAHEFPLDKEGQHQFRENFRDRFEGDPAKSLLYKDVSAGLAPSGVEYYLPLFFAKTSTVFDYLPANTELFLHRDVQAITASAEAFWADTKSRYDLLRSCDEWATKYVIKAPNNGYLVWLKTEPQNHSLPIGTPLFSITADDIEPSYCQLLIPEVYINQVKIGQTALIDWNNQSIPLRSRITNIAAVPNEKNYLVSVVFDETTKSLIESPPTKVAAELVIQDARLVEYLFQPIKLFFEKQKQNKQNTVETETPKLVKYTGH